MIKLRYYVDWSFSTFFGVFEKGRYCKYVDGVVGGVLDKIDEGEPYRLWPSVLKLGEVEIHNGEWFSCGWLWNNYNRDSDKHTCSLKNKVRLKMLVDKKLKENSLVAEEKRIEQLNKLKGGLQ